MGRMVPGSMDGNQSRESEVDLTASLFNGYCDKCNLFKPRCANVYLPRIDGSKGTAPGLSVICEHCRRLPEYKGKFRFHHMHTRQVPT